MTHIPFNDFMENCQNRVEKLFSLYLQPTNSPAQKLQQAMNDAVLNGGKRIRPLLVYATGYALNVSWENLDIPASAIELIHTYSLIHDDLPAMDNADLRRGKPACHKTYGEAVAILAGDALQPLAFEILATHPAELSAEQRLAMIQVLSHASGLNGMAGGQALDIAGVTQLAPLNQMYALKTGALITASVKLGMLGANNYDPALPDALENFAKYLGLAFQIQDDLLDVESPSTLIGKPQGLDLNNKKITYPSLLGIKEAHAKVHDLFTKALQAIELLGERAVMLHLLTDYMLQRKK